jgi:phospholipase/carboxylesterase
MNRIKISPLAAIDRKPESATATDPQDDTTLNRPLSPADCFEKLAFGSDEELSLFVPMHFEKNYAYPLIVWLHDNEHSVEQLQTIMPLVSMRNYLGVAPAAPALDRERNQMWLQDPRVIDEAHESVLQAIDHATMRFKVNPAKIFLAGAGQGGTMAFRLAFQRPDLFAGVMSLNGALPTERSLLGDWSRCRNMPVFWAHCRDSVDFDQDTLCEQLRLLHVAGFNVTLRQYPGFAMLSKKMLADGNAWVMESIQSVIS